MFSGIVAIFQAIPALISFLISIASLIKTAWQAYNAHQLEVESKEAAQKLKSAALDARSGDTTNLEKWFNPNRTYDKTIDPIDPSSTTH